MQGLKMRYFNNVMLILTDNCNLRCTYCYAHEHNNTYYKTMSFETAKKAVDLMLNNAPEGMERTSISFFGGEPNLAFDMIKKVVEYTYPHRTIGGYKGNDFNYVLITNGTVLTEEMFNFYKGLGKKLNIRISIDGYKEKHDITRKTINGTGSWTLLEKNIPYYKELREKYGVKINLINTVSTSNCRDIYYNYTNLYELTGMSIAVLYVHEDPWTKEDFDAIKEQALKLHDYCVPRNFRMPICSINSKQQSECIECSECNHSFCNSGIRTFTVDYNGYIHPCHRTYYFKMGGSYVIGHADKGISNARRAFIHEVNNLKMMGRKCSECNPAIKLRCHICYPSNFRTHGNPHKISSEYCLFQKELYYLLLEKEANVKNKNVRMTTNRPEQQDTAKKIPVYP